MPIRSALTKTQKTAVRTVAGATALVMSLNKDNSRMEYEIAAHKITIKETQDQLEEWREKYHKSDKSNGILSSKLSFFAGVEVVKYVVSAVGTGYGVNLLSTDNINGAYLIVFSIVIYVIIAVWQNKK